MDMSTPIQQNDYTSGGGQIVDTDPDVANSILDKLNNININVSPNSGYEGDLPPINPEIPMMEHEMENRNMNAQIENMRYMNPISHIEAQKAAAAAAAAAQADYEEEEYEEMEEVETRNPLWKKILNELRIVIFVMIMTLFLFNQQFNKLITQYIPLFRLNNYTYETNIMGNVAKALIVGLCSYGLIRSVKF